MILALLLALAPGDSILLRVLTVNDFHGALEPRIYGWSAGKQIGGIAALKATVDRLAGECACPVLRIDAGDEMQGTLASNATLGRTSVEAMNLLGLDAAALGNHDFDWGVATLRERIGEARYPWLAANVFDSAAGTRPAWARPAAILTAGPHRVAVIGYVTPRTKAIVMAKQVAGLAFRGGRAAIHDVLDEVKRQSPDLTILAAHEGAFCDSLACRGAIIDLAAELDPTEVQLIVAGHTHARVVTRAHGIPVVSAGANGAMVGIADLVATDGGHEWRIRVDTVFADRVPADSAAVRLLARSRPLVERTANRIIVRLRDSLLTRGTEFPLGGLIADAQRAATHADFAVMNRGGIRRELYPGPVTYGQLFELHPFGNTLVRVTLTGDQLEALLEQSLAGFRPDLFPSGMTVRYDPTRPPGRRVLEIRRASGAPVIRDRRYTVGLSDFLANGGGGYSLLVGRPRAETGIVDLDALIGWLRRQPQPIRVGGGRRLIPVTP